MEKQKGIILRKLKQYDRNSVEAKLRGRGIKITGFAGTTRIVIPQGVMVGIKLLGMIDFLDPVSLINENLT